MKKRSKTFWKIGEAQRRAQQESNAHWNLDQKLRELNARHTERQFEQERLQEENRRLREGIATAVRELGRRFVLTRHVNNALVALGAKPRKTGKTRRQLHESG